MKKAACAFTIVIGLMSCTTMPAAAVFSGLRRGMTEQDFLNQKVSRMFTELAPVETANFPPGTFADWAAPAPWKSVRIVDDRWDIWVYEVIRRTSPTYVSTHREYAVFKNKQLVSWGLGTPSRRMLTHPDQFIAER